MINFKLEKNNDDTVLTVIGDASIENASIIKKKFLEVSNDKSLVINLDNIKQTDISFVQLILSLINEFENSKSKKLSFSYKNQDAIIISYLKNYGFAHIPDIINYFKISGD